MTRWQTFPVRPPYFFPYAKATLHPSEQMPFVEPVKQREGVKAAADGVPGQILVLLVHGFAFSVTEDGFSVSARMIRPHSFANRPLCVFFGKKSPTK